MTTDSAYELIERCLRKDHCRGIRDCPLYRALDKRLHQWLEEIGGRELEPTRHLCPDEQDVAAMKLYATDGGRLTAHLTGIKDSEMMKGCVIGAFLHGGDMSELYNDLYQIRKESMQDLEPVPETAEPVREDPSQRNGSL